MNPLQKRTSMFQSKLTILLIWLVSTLVAVPMLFFFEFTYVYDELTGGDKPFCTIATMLQPMEQEDIRYCMWVMLLLLYWSIIFANSLTNWGPWRCIKVCSWFDGKIACQECILFLLHFMRFYVDRFGRSFEHFMWTLTFGGEYAFSCKLIISSIARECYLIMIKNTNFQTDFGNK